MIALSIDGREVQVEPGTSVWQAAKQAGVDIPIFCYHPRMPAVGACRMCLVRVEKMPKLQPACTTLAAEGMAVRTDTDDVVQSHEGVLEFLLSTHPLDCPVCDAGGECDLQNNALRYGANDTRFAEPRRHLKKAWDLGPMVELDQERCILCTRCVRFMQQVAGDPALTLHERGNHTVVDVAQGRRFDSIFAGNTIELCPVGALTSRPYRFAARPWDLDTVDSICPHCPVGCRTTLSLRHGDVLRILARDSDEVNQSWLCDRGRFGYGFVHQAPRLTAPRVGQGGEGRSVGWDEALAVLQERLQGRVGVLGGGRLSLEAQHLLARWLKERVGTAHIDHRVQPLAAAIPPGPVGRIDDADTADLVLAVEAELLEEAPVFALRLRQAAARGARIVSVARRGGLLDMPHEDHRTARVAEELASIARGEGPLGQAFLQAGKVLLVTDGRDPGVLQGIAALVAARSGPTSTLVVGGVGNSYGAEASGLLPGPGGLDVSGMLRAAAAGDLDALLVLAQDPLDFPDPDLLEQALRRIPFLAVAGCVPNALSERAHLVLPLTAWVESDGHYVNMEGRAQRFSAGASHPGATWQDWQVFARLLGVGPGYAEVLDAVRQALGDLFSAPRRMGRPLPDGAPAKAPDEAWIIAPSLFQKGVLPDPLLAPIIPGPTVFLAPERARALGWGDGEQVALPGANVFVRVAPGLPPATPMTRLGMRLPRQALAALAAAPVPAGGG